MKKIWIVTLIVFLLSGCTAFYDNREIVYSGKYPNFYNSVDDYFYTSTYEKEIEFESYYLTVINQENLEKQFNLYDLASYDRSLSSFTSESIFNGNNGMYISNGIWEGLRLYEFLMECGASDDSYIKISNDDGYFVVLSMEELDAYNGLLALYLNGEELSFELGFPVRFVITDYYSEKQIGQVSKIEILDEDQEDFWELRGWHTDEKIKVNSKIFSPNGFDTVKLYDEVTFYGASFSPDGIDFTEISFDGGITWYETEKIKSDGDKSWVFWKYPYRFQESGVFMVFSRAVDSQGEIQEYEDDNKYDGNNSYGMVKIKVTN